MRPETSVRTVWHLLMPQTALRFGCPRTRTPCLAFVLSFLLAAPWAMAQGNYEGREPTAAWRATAAARIEQIRKGDFTLSVVDAAGAPLAGATVSVTQTR